MRFHIADDHIHALFPALVGSFEHGVGLANPGGVSQEDLQPTAGGFFRLDVLQQFIGIGAIVHRIHFISSSAKFNRRTLTRGSPRKPNVRAFGDIDRPIA